MPGERSVTIAKQQAQASLKKAGKQSAKEKKAHRKSTRIAQVRAAEAVVRQEGPVYAAGGFGGLE